MTTPIPVQRRSISVLDRVSEPGLDLTIVTRPHAGELHLTVRPRPGEQPSMMLWRLASVLREHSASVVRQEIFGRLEARAELLGQMGRLLGQIDWPITWLDTDAGTSGPIAGMHLLAVTGTPVQTIEFEGRVAGRIFDDGYARHCLLGDIGPARLSAPKEIQAAQTFERMEAALAVAGMKITEVIRTWLFMDEILGWYGPFNLVRKEFFTKRRLFDGLVPASTGVGMRNPAGAALLAGAWATQPNNGALAIREVLSPLQCPARSYGSCFSRAVEIRSPCDERLLISGTASIEPGGRSAHPGDPRKQIQLTMEVVAAILESCRMSFADVTRSTVYFKQLADARLFEQWCQTNDLDIPGVWVEADICRDELLFEIELDAMTTGHSALSPKPAQDRPSSHRD